MKEKPPSVKEAVDELISRMSDQDKAYVRSREKDDVIGFHHGWNRAIQNSFGLWAHNEVLKKDTGKEHPDDAAEVIIEAVWTKLRELPIKAIVK